MTTTPLTPYQVGRAAYEHGEPRTAPFAPEGRPVGANDSYVADCKAWLSGWDAANLAAPCTSSRTVYEPNTPELAAAMAVNKARSDAAIYFEVDSGDEHFRDGDEWACAECGEAVGPIAEENTFVRCFTGPLGPLCIDCVSIHDPAPFTSDDYVYVSKPRPPQPPCDTPGCGAESTVLVVDNSYPIHWGRYCAPCGTAAQAAARAALIPTTNTTNTTTCQETS